MGGCEKKVKGIIYFKSYIKSLLFIFSIIISFFFLLIILITDGERVEYVWESANGYSWERACINCSSVALGEIK